MGRMLRLAEGRLHETVVFPTVRRGEAV
jgi:hypothetical protein